MTPKSYLSFINGYKTVYSLKRKQIGELGSRMNTGLDKLMEASESVAELSKQLAVKEKELAVASQKADAVWKIVKSEHHPRQTPDISYMFLLPGFKRSHSICSSC